METGGDASPCVSPDPEGSCAAALVRRIGACIAPSPGRPGKHAHLCKPCRWEQRLGSPSLQGHVSVGARVVRNGGEGLYGRPRSPPQGYRPNNEHMVMHRIGIFGSTGATRQGSLPSGVLSQARRKRSMLPTYRTKWKGRKTNDQAIHPMDSAAGSNCTNWGILSSLANGGYTCSRPCCPRSAFSNYNVSWPNARLFLAPLINQAALTRSLSSDKTKCIVTARTFILAQPTVDFSQSLISCTLRCPIVSRATTLASPSLSSFLDIALGSYSACQPIMCKCN